ncbi:MAG: phosphoribosylanthranilate isomerase [Candidatus Omnitrophica bacterium]|nr:phosphoribosylanthranilate isomerase [Candidatus Omnitrophota bacterium]
MIRVKICGIARVEDAIWAVRCGADAIGMVFAESPRRVNAETAMAICRELGPLVVRVGVFVNQSVDEIFELIRDCSLDAVQMHRATSPYERKLLRSRGIRIIQATRVRGEEFVDEISPQDADAVLLDTYSENMAGGTGKSFDWYVATRAKSWNVPLILSGGLSPYNVSEAIRQVAPYAVDVSSGVEEFPGRKDPGKVKEFIERAKNLR